MWKPVKQSFFRARAVHKAVGQLKLEKTRSGHSVGMCKPVLSQRLSPLWRKQCKQPYLVYYLENGRLQLSNIIGTKYNLNGWKKCFYPRLFPVQHCALSPVRDHKRECSSLVPLPGLSPAQCIWSKLDRTWIQIFFSANATQKCKIPKFDQTPVAVSIPRR